jgi:hypothetical protein
MSRIIQTPIVKAIYNASGIKSTIPRSVRAVIYIYFKIPRHMEESV